MEAHKNLLHRIEEISKNDWPNCRRFGEVVVNEAGKGLGVYGSYIQNLVNSQETIRRLCSDRNSRFSIWLQEVESKGAKDLQFLLSEPFQHISKMEGCVNVSFYKVFIEFLPKF